MSLFHFRGVGYSGILHEYDDAFICPICTCKNDCWEFMEGKEMVGEVKCVGCKRTVLVNIKIDGSIQATEI